MLRLDDLEVFVAVVKAASLAVAASNLRISRASVTRQLQRLEAALGIRLIRRDSRKLVLTAAGSRLIPLAETLVSQASDIKGEFAANVTVPASIHVTAQPYFAQSKLIPVIGMFFRDNSNVSVHLEMSSRYRNVNLNETDVMFNIGPLQDDTVSAIHIGAEEVILTAAPSYLERSANIVSVTDLREHSFLDIRPDVMDRDIELVSGTATERVRIRPRFACNDPSSLTKLAISGLGVTFTPVCLATELLSTGQLRRVLTEWSVRPREVNALYAGGRGKEKAISQFLRAVQFAFKVDAELKKGLTAPGTRT